METIGTNAIGIGIVIFGLIIVVVWIMFPLLVLTRMGLMLKEARRSNDALARLGWYAERLHRQSTTESTTTEPEPSQPYANQL